MLYNCNAKPIITKYVTVSMAVIYYNKNILLLKII